MAKKRQERNVYRIEKPYSFFNNVLQENKYMLICFFLGAILVAIFLINNDRSLLDYIPIESNLFEKSGFLLIGFMALTFIVALVLAIIIGIVQSIVKNIPLLTVSFFSIAGIFSVTLVVVTGAINGLLRFVIQFIKFPINLIIWIATKLSRRAYYHFITYEFIETNNDERH